MSEYVQRQTPGETDQDLSAAWAIRRGLADEMLGSRHSNLPDKMEPVPPHEAVATPERKRLTGRQVDDAVDRLLAYEELFNNDGYDNYGIPLDKYAERKISAIRDEVDNEYVRRLADAILAPPLQDMPWQTKKALFLQNKRHLDWLEPDALEQAGETEIEHIYRQSLEMGEYAYYAWHERADLQGHFERRSPGLRYRYQFAVDTLVETGHDRAFNQSVFLKLSGNLIGLYDNSGSLASVYELDPEVEAQADSRQRQHGSLDLNEFLHLRAAVSGEVDGTSVAQYLAYRSQLPERFRHEFERDVDMPEELPEDFQSRVEWAQGWLKDPARAADFQNVFDRASEDMPSLEKIARSAPLSRDQLAVLYSEMELGHREIDPHFGPGFYLYERQMMPPDERAKIDEKYHLSSLPGEPFTYDDYLRLPDDVVLAEMSKISGAQRIEFCADVREFAREELNLLKDMLPQARPVDLARSFEDLAPDLEQASRMTRDFQVMAGNLRLRKAIEQDYHLRLDEYDLRSQANFISFLKTADTATVERVKSFGAAYGSQAVESFLAMEQGDTFGNSLLTLAERLPEAELRPLLEKVQEIRDLSVVIRESKIGDRRVQKDKAFALVQRTTEVLKAAEELVSRGDGFRMGVGDLPCEIADMSQIQRQLSALELIGRGAASHEATTPVESTGEPEVWLTCTNPVTFSITRSVEAERGQQDKQWEIGKACRINQRTVIDGTPLPQDLSTIDMKWLEAHTVSFRLDFQDNAMGIDIGGKVKQEVITGPDGEVAKKLDRRAPDWQLAEVLSVGAALHARDRQAPTEDYHVYGLTNLTAAEFAAQVQAERADLRSRQVPSVSRQDQQPDRAAA